ncbi:hypothetical protein ACS0TY_003738 [Phlomoides rotata]
MVKDMDEWMSHWFIWYHPWSEKDVCQRRKVCTRWYGVPAHAWMTRFFKLASVKVGSFVKLDPITENKGRLDATRVLISVPFLHDVNQVFEADIEGTPFRIKIVEEFDWSQDSVVAGKEENQSGENDDSCWSEETSDSVLFSMENATEHGNSEVVLGGYDDVQSSLAIGINTNSHPEFSGARIQAGVVDNFTALPTIQEDACLIKSMGEIIIQSRDMEVHDTHACDNILGGPHSSLKISSQQIQVNPLNGPGISPHLNIISVGDVG